MCVARRLSVRRRTRCYPTGMVDDWLLWRASPWRPERVVRQIWRTAARSPLVAVHIDIRDLTATASKLAGWSFLVIFPSLWFAL